MIGLFLFAIPAVLASQGNVLHPTLACYKDNNALREISVKYFQDPTSSYAKLALFEDGVQKTEENLPCTKVSPDTLIPCSNENYELDLGQGYAYLTERDRPNAKPVVLPCFKLGSVPQLGVPSSRA